MSSVDSSLELSFKSLSGFDGCLIALQTFSASCFDISPVAINLETQSEISIGQAGQALSPGYGGGSLRTDSTRERRNLLDEAELGKVLAGSETQLGKSLLGNSINGLIVHGEKF